MATIQIFSGPGTGWATSLNYNNTWTTAHDATTGTSVGYNETSIYVVSQWRVSDRTELRRCFVPIDTSTIVESVEITGASLFLNASVKDAAIADNDAQAYIGITETDQPSETVLTTADYNNCGSTTGAATEVATHIMIEDIDLVDTYYEFPITDLSVVNKAGYTKLGVREGHDLEDVPVSYAGTDFQNNGVSFYSVAETGTDKDPYLEVTYSTDLPDIGWLSSQEITIDNTKVSGSADLTDFPVYLDTNAFDSDVFTNALSTGADIRFTTDSAGTTQIPFEIVSWDSSAETCEIHTKVPTVQYDADTSIYVWYNNSTASALASDATYGSEAVWSDYLGVYHLKETTGNFIDSTANGYDATVYGTLPNQITGKIGYGQDFNGTSDYAIISSVPRPDNHITVSMWVNNIPATLTQYPMLFGADDVSTSPAYRTFQYRIERDTGLLTFIQFGATENTTATGTTDLRNSSTPRYLVARYSTTNGLNRVFVDGTMETSTENSVKDSFAESTGNGIAIGNVSNVYNSSTYYIPHDIDETRICELARTDDWIATEYANQNSPSTFAVAVGGDTPTTYNALSLCNF